MTDKYKKLSLREHVLLRPDMYMGSITIDRINDFIYDADTCRFKKTYLNYSAGLAKIFDEILTNAIDHHYRLSQEKSKNPVKNIKVNIDKQSGEIKVWNDGQGISTAMHPQHNMPIPEMLFSEFHTSSNYNDNEERLVSGLNGIGSKLTVVLSKQFSVETVNSDEGQKFVQTYSENLSKKSKAKITSNSRSPYTCITFLPDYPRFGSDGLSDDMFKVFEKRVYDVCAVTATNLNVYLNSAKISVPSFERYVDLYIGPKSDVSRIYEKSANGRWEIVCCASPTYNFAQISFVNSSPTLNGGTHVNYLVNQITKGIEEIAKKKKLEINDKQFKNIVKNNMMVFVKAVINQPTYTSQAKDTLATKQHLFGSKFEISDKFMASVYKNSGIIDKVTSMNNAVNEKQIAKTDGKKVSRVIINNFNDAPMAGGKNSSECYLFICEGLSAKTMVVSGLSVIGTDKYGIAPLKGKLLNTRQATVKKLSDNMEITNLKKILGLESGKTYTDTSSLRYNGIIILTDADLDGYHIRGLICNMFQSLWPSLFKMKGFLTTMMTPIVKARKGNEKKYFFTLQEFQEWERNNPTRNWNITYLKGAGSSTAEEAKEFFKNMKKITYNYTDNSDDAMDLAFNMNKSDERKEWLEQYDKNRVLDIPDSMEVSYEDYVNKELIHFSQQDLIRSITHLCDNLKESQRKILYTCFKKNYKSANNEIKVSQLSGIVASTTQYHHGDVSLSGAIVGMAQNYVGSNNISLLAQSGQFGTRIANGDDAAQPRYIFTYLTSICKYLFREEDMVILNYKEEEGQKIEPEYFIPVIPTVFLTKTYGIATGYSSWIPNYNPKEIIEQCKLLCSNLKEKLSNDNNLDDVFRIINSTMFTNLTPYYLGFKGDIYLKSDDESLSYETKGVYNVISDNTIEITEIPIEKSIEDYKKHLEQLLLNNKIKDFQSHYTTLNIKFIVTLNAGYNMANIINDFNLTSTRHISCNNMHLFSENGAIKKFKNMVDIMKEWCSIRYTKYVDRKNYMLSLHEKEYKILYWKTRFIQDVISGKVKIMNVANSVLQEQLEKLEYPKLNVNDDSGKSYNYLLKMPINTLTKEHKEKLENDASSLRTVIDELKKKHIYDIWLNELDELETEYIKYKDEFEDIYRRDLESANSNTSTKKSNSRAKSRK